MRIKTLTFILMMVCLPEQIKAQTETDTSRYRRPYIGFTYTIPYYESCSLLKFDKDIKNIITRLTLWKPAIDSFTFEIKVHTVCYGDSLKNLIRSQAIADSISQFLRKRCDIDVYAIGVGENELFNECKCEGQIKIPCSEDSHQQNRRIVVKIIGKRE